MAYFFPETGKEDEHKDSDLWDSDDISLKDSEQEPAESDYFTDEDVDDHADEEKNLL